MIEPGIGDIVRFKEGNRAGSGPVIRIATGHGYPCYLVDWKDANDPYPRWVGGESLLGEHKIDRD